MSQENVVRIVVGVDDSDGAQAALRFALHEALVRGAGVQVVTSWSWTPPGEALVPTRSIEEAHAAASAMQAQIVKTELEHLLERPPVSQATVRAPAGEALIAAAEHAEMLVVGTGHKGVARRISQGSVSEYCVRHATVPVVVVPAAHRVSVSRGRHLPRSVAVGYPMF